MSGMTMGPDKCGISKLNLLLLGSTYGLSPTGLHQWNKFNYKKQIVKNPSVPPKYSILELDAVSILTGFGLQLSFWRLLNFKLNPITVVRDVWNDCDIGGGLKRKLEQFRASASEVVGKWLPAPAPIPVPIRDQFTAMDLPIEWGQGTSVTPGAMLTHGGTGMLDQVMWGIAGGAALIYGGIVLTPAVAAATPAAYPTLASAAAL